jgi:hypothetical protein
MLKNGRLLAGYEAAADRILQELTQAIRLIFPKPEVRPGRVQCPLPIHFEFAYLFFGACFPVGEGSRPILGNGFDLIEGRPSV